MLMRTIGNSGLEYGFGGRGVVTGLSGVGKGDDAGGIHFVETDVEAYGSCHQQVVMV